LCKFGLEAAVIEFSLSVELECIRETEAPGDVEIGEFTRVIADVSRFLLVFVQWHARYGVGQLRVHRQLFILIAALELALHRNAATGEFTQGQGFFTPDQFIDPFTPAVGEVGIQYAVGCNVDLIEKIGAGRNAEIAQLEGIGQEIVTAVDAEPVEQGDLLHRPCAGVFPVPDLDLDVVVESECDPPEPALCETAENAAFIHIERRFVAKGIHLGGIPELLVHVGLVTNGNAWPDLMAHRFQCAVLSESEHAEDAGGGAHTEGHFAGRVKSFVDGRIHFLIHGIPAAFELLLVPVFLVRHRGCDLQRPDLWQGQADGNRMAGAPLEFIDQLVEESTGRIVKGRQAFDVRVQGNAYVLVPFEFTGRFLTAEGLKGVHIKGDIGQVDVDELAGGVLVVIGAYREIKGFVLPDLGISNG